ncbi:MAG: hypothetical protein GC180_07585 [Bacteroidetes bacterium]|nr:hypothetical protein [Bacteroidota bacterium]
MRHKLLVLFFLSIPITVFAQPQSGMAIYRLWDLEEHNTAFFSMSDSYWLSEHPDSICAPDTCIGEGLKDEVVRYFELKGKYRRLFMQGTQTKESDKVYVYDFRQNKEVAYKVKDLKLMALLSPYEGAEYGAVGPYSYMIGFEIPKKELMDCSPYFRDVFVAVEAKSPFAKKEMEAIRWKEIDTLDCPAFPLNYLDTVYGVLNFHANKVFISHWKNYVYYLQVAGEHYYSNMRLLVIDDDSKEIVGNFRYFSGESASSAPLNFMNPESPDQISQWTGQLFKNRPPVVFGFQYHSFGCASIDFLGNEMSLEISCDNRH